MKITILSTAYPLRGGIAHFNGLLYKEFSTRHEVNVITFKRQYPELLFPGKTQLTNDEATEVIPSEVLVDSINPLNWRKVGKKIKSEAPDLLVLKYWMPFFGPCFGTISKIVKKNNKTKIVVICDNVIPHERKPGDIVFTKYFFKHVDYFVTMSDSVERDLQKIKPGAKSKLLFHPVYSNFGDPVEKEKALGKLNLENKKTILFFGFIREYKGLDVLLKAFSLLNNKEEYQLVVAGEFYSDEKKYIDLISELGIEKYVKLFSDFIPTSDVKYYFSAADFVALPYKSATQSGIVQIANNFLKPVVATDVGGLGEIIKDGYNGYVVEPNSPQAFADAIEKFYSEADQLKMRENIKSELNKFSWSKFVEEIEELVSADE